MTIVNLLLAMLLGGVIGWYREKEGKSAGLRTHILVAVGSSLFMVLSAQLAQMSLTADPGRLVSGVVTGIGFIGAGCILHAPGQIKGITTAASIWITAAIGIAAGLGSYVSAVAATIITLATLEILGRAERLIIKSKDSLE